MSVQIVTRYATLWGVPVQSKREDEDASLRGPGGWSLAHWGKAPYIFPKETIGATGGRRWPFLLHEPAHVACPAHPYNTDELEDTVGFEVLSILHLGLSMQVWENWMASFAIDQDIGCI